MLEPAAGEMVLPGSGIDLRWSQVLRWYTWLVSIIGWVLGGFLIAGLGGLAKRD